MDKQSYLQGYQDGLKAAKSTSLLSWESITEKELNSLHRRILDALKRSEWTRRELSSVTGICLSSVCARVHELKTSGYVEVSGRKKDQITGKTVEIIKLIGE